MTTGMITRENKGPFVAELADKMTTQSVFLVREKNFGTGKNGKSFLSLQLSDRTGAIDARIWDNAEAMQLIVQSGDIVQVKGVVQTFQNRLQFVVHKLERLNGAEVEGDLLIAASRRSIETMSAELAELVAGLDPGPVRTLIKNVLADPEVERLFRVRPAAKTIHHAYRGGLLEHVLSIAKLMNLVHAHYAADGVVMDRSLLVFGAIFHDIGKIWELEGDGPYSYSQKGRLLGHMALAIELIERASQDIDDFPELLKDKLKHIVLSHHGRLEYGSPKEPMFLEAFVVAMLDDFDSKVNSLAQFVDGERTSHPSAEWSRIHPQLGRYLLLR